MSARIQQHAPSSHHHSSSADDDRLVGRWAKWTLRAAATYNLTWGAWVILFPMSAFELAGMPEPIYPQIWQCVGMIVGVYGVGYAIAATNPLRHWPIILVGLLGKVLGPIGFAVSAFRGSMPWSWGWIIVLNDLVWWAPFGFILMQAWRLRRSVQAKHATDSLTTS